MGAIDNVKEVAKLVKDLGNMELYRQIMLHDEGGGVMASFPVYFCKDGNGNWKIYCF